MLRGRQGRFRRCRGEDFGVGIQQPAEEDQGLPDFPGIQVVDKPPSGRVEGHIEHKEMAQRG